MCDPPRTYPSLPEYTPLFNKCIYVTLPESTSPSQNIPPFSPTTCDPLRIYPSQIIPPFSTNVYVRPSQNIPLPLKINPLFNNYVRPSQNICPSLLEYTPPFSTTIILCDPSRIDPSLPEYTPPFSTTIILCDPPRIYPSLPEYTSPLFNKCICVTLQNLPLPPRIYPLFNNSMRPSQNLLLPPRIYPFQQMYNMCDPPRIYLFLPGYTPPPFSTTICDPPRIYPSLLE